LARCSASTFPQPPNTSSTVSRHKFAKFSACFAATSLSNRGLGQHVALGGWTLDEWEFFLDQIESKYLKPGGHLVLMIKDGRLKEPNQIDDPAFMALWQKRGGDLDRRWLYLRKPALEVAEKAVLS
jgi:hypothetical protein